MFLPPNRRKKIKERRTRLFCKGIAGINPEHNFLKVEGIFTCLSCHTCFCRTCGYSPDKDRDKKWTKIRSLIHYQQMDEPLCVDCYQQNIFLPHSMKLDDVLSLNEMQRYLKNHNQSLPKDATAHETQETYEMCKIIEGQDTNRTKDVPFPIYSSHTLTIRHHQYKKFYSFGEAIHTFSFDQGGRFIGIEKNIPDQLVAPVIDLFASVVRYDKEKRKNTHFDSPVYDVMPHLFIDFADKSRTSKGLCLLKRCLCHSFDPKTTPLMETTATLFVRNKDDNVGLVLNNKIAASMKDAEYEVTAAFTKKDFINSMQMSVSCRRTQQRKGSVCSHTTINISAYHVT